MRHVITLALLMTGAMGAQAGQATGACGQAVLADVPLLITPGDEVLMPVSLGGRDVYFTLTMRSGLPVVRESAIGALGLTPQVINTGSEFKSGDQRLRHYVKLEELKIGGYKLLTRAALVMPEPGAEAVPTIEGRPLVGLLGSDMFRNVDAEILIRERRLRLLRSVPCVGRSLVDWQGAVTTLPMRFDDAGTLVFNLDINGRKVESTLLSGDEISRLDANVARRYLGLQEGSSRSMTVSLSGQSLRLDAVETALYEGPPDCKLVGSRPGHGGIGYDCVNIVPFHLGLDVLTRLRVYLSAKRQQVLLAMVPD